MYVTSLYRHLNGMRARFLNVQFHTKCAVLKKLCAVLMKNLWNWIIYFLFVQGCKKVNSCKTCRFRYEIIGEAQPEMELLEEVAVIYPFAKSRQFNPICNQNLILQHCIDGFLCSSKFFFKSLVNILHNPTPPPLNNHIFTPFLMRCKM